MSCSSSPNGIRDRIRAEDVADMQRRTQNQKKYLNRALDFEEKPSRSEKQMSVEGEHVVMSLECNVQNEVSCDVLSASSSFEFNIDLYEGAYPVHIEKAGCKVPCPSTCDFPGCTNVFVDCVEVQHKSSVGFHLVATDDIKEGSWISCPYPGIARSCKCASGEYCVCVKHGEKMYCFQSASAASALKNIKGMDHNLCASFCEKMTRDLYPCLIKHACCKADGCRCNRTLNVQVVAYEVSPFDLHGYRPYLSFSHAVLLEEMMHDKKESIGKKRVREDVHLHAALRACRDIEAGEILFADTGIKSPKDCACPSCAVVDANLFRLVTNNFKSDMGIRTLYNYHLHQRFYENVCVGLSTLNNAGDGLFAGQDFEANCVVGVYTGTPMKYLEPDSSRSYVIKLQSCPCYMTEDEWSSYLSDDSEGVGVYIDGEEHNLDMWGFTGVKSLMACINHRDDPNTKCLSDGTVVTLRKIKAGEEFFMQYRHSGMSQFWNEIPSDNV